MTSVNDAFPRSPQRYSSTGYFGIWERTEVCRYVLLKKVSWVLSQDQQTDIGDHKHTCTITDV